MLTLESILKVTKQQTAYGEGLRPHRFGGPEPRTVPRTVEDSKEDTAKDGK